MKLLAGTQIREWDAYTITHEPVSSIDLMERASRRFADWFEREFPDTSVKVGVFCGNGNNGGDGLAIARMLRDRFYTTKVWVLRIGKEDTPDFDVNLARLLKLGDVSVDFIHDNLPEMPENGVIIDALLGTGVTRPVTGNAELLIHAINQSACKVISVDMPSGLPTEGPAAGTAIEADMVYTFQVPKLSFFHPENEKYCPEWKVGTIGLHEAFLERADSGVFLVDSLMAAGIIRKRTRFQHKGDFGHVLMVAGSEGKGGAAILACKAALRSGAGLVTACVPSVVVTALHASVPEAMAFMSGHTFVSDIPDGREQYTIGCGPGLGVSVKTRQTLALIIEASNKPLVLDADALNIMAFDKSLLDILPENSILTPHPGEFRRLFGTCKDSFEMFDLQNKMAVDHRVIIVLKGAYTRTATPDGKTYINSTGNPGMATAGSGDVLTGIITGLLAQEYSPEEAAVLGVWLHGRAGDLAAEALGMQALMAGDILNHIGQAYQL